MSTAKFSAKQSRTSVKIAFITSLYQTYLSRIYERNPQLAASPYEAQMQTVLSDCFGFTQFWSAALGSLGYESTQIISNALPLQRAWAKEVSFSGSLGNGEFIMRQIAATKPDIVLIDAMELYSESFFKALRTSASSLKLIVGWCGSPYQNIGIFRGLDLLLTNIGEFVAQFRQHGIPTAHIHHAFSADVLTRLDTARPRDIELSFLGALIKGEGYHRERERILGAVASSLPIQIFSDVPSWSMKSAVRYALRAASARFSGRDVVLSCSVNPSITRVAQESRYGLEMFQTLRDSQITLNVHIDVSPKSASNMRLFEATGVGTCLVTDWRPDLSQLFVPDAEVVTYQNAAECVEKIRYLMNHRNEREAIARAGQARTLKDHTFHNRVAIFDSLVREHLR